MSFVWVATNLEHVQNAKVAISVNDPINFDTLQVVDRYVENGTGFCAERVHDTDLQNALLALPYRDDVIAGADVALPAGGGYTAVSDWIDVRSFTWFSPGVVNTGAQNVIFLGVYIAIDAAGTNAALYFSSACTITAGTYGQLGGNVVGSQFSYVVPALFVRVYAASTNGTTVRARLLRRRGGC